MVKNARGVTLTELMVAVVLLSVGILGFFSAFQFITKSIGVSRARTLATNLAQEKVELLKNLNYYQLLITTSSSVDTNFTPNIVYDNTNYPPETISIGGIDFLRYTYVALAQVDSNVISTVTYTYPDTGMKQITVHVTWSQNGERKKWSLSNLIENPNVNPLDSSFSGTISSAVTGVPIAGALVKVQENPDWNATTDSSGYYSFRVYHGSYTIRASSSGWYDATSTVQTANSGSNTTLNLSMSRIASGTISGALWLNTDLVISQVVASSNTYEANGSVAKDVEYVELFNPTTFPINIAGAAKQIHLNYDNEAGADCLDACFNLVYVTSYVPPLRYYLISNTSAFLMEGSFYNADAYWSGKKLAANQAGAIYISRPDTGRRIDTVGWADDDNAAPLFEGNQIPDPAANDSPVAQGKQLVRVSSPAASLMTTGTYGKAYDSDDNRDDFLYQNDVFTFPPLPLFFAPRTTSHPAETVLTGKPAVGAYVAATDSLSGSTQAVRMSVSSGALSLDYAYFKVNSVATGTWSVVTATGAHYKEINNVVVGNGSNTPILNAVTDPAQLMAGHYHVFLDSAHVGGFVQGRVTSVNGLALSGITVNVGGVTKTTGANGTYFAKVSSGPVTVIANPNNANTTYQQGITLVDVAQGQIAAVDFILSQGGTITGFVTTGTTPLPNIVVTALISGNQYGTGTSDSAGTFYIRGVSTGTYTVQPVLEAGQDSNPNSYSGVVVTAASTVNVGTFTVSGAFGTIEGVVTYNGETVTTGALILASTAAIPATPPSIAGSSSPALTPMYAVSSRADGTFELPVRGNAGSYRLSAYVPVISVSGSVSVTTKTYTGISVTPSAVTTQNITVP